MKNQKGFTLIELMIVVAIIGILASIAVPQYQDYVARSKVTSLYSSMAATKTLLAGYYSDEGVMPLGSSDAVGKVEFDAIISGVNQSPYANSTAAITAPGGTDSALLTVTLDGVTGAVNGQKLMILFNGSGPTFTLDCKAATAGTTVPEKFLPKPCKV